MMSLTLTFGLYQSHASPGLWVATLTRPAHAHTHTHTGTKAHRPLLQVKNDKESSPNVNTIRFIIVVQMKKEMASPPYLHVQMTRR